MRTRLTAIFLVLVILGTIGGAVYYFNIASTGDTSWPAAPLSSSSPIPFDPDATPVEPSAPTINLDAGAINSPDAYIPRGRDAVPTQATTETPPPTEEPAF